MLIGFLVAAALASAATSIPRPEMVRCLGTPYFAANLEDLAQARAEAGQQAWVDACRGAREADARRRATIRVLFDTGTSPLPGYASATKYVRLAQAARDPVHRSLYLHVARDQAARESTQQTEKAGFAAGATPLTLRLVDAISSGEGLRADAENRTWLLSTIARRGWFTISRDGEAADNAAWLIAQHSDADRGAQRRIIARLEPLAASGETNPRRFALLFDRWARGANQPQRYGLNGECTAPGIWTPRPIEDEAELDARRQGAGLPTMAEHVAAQAKACR